jgi:hypothetical protein
MREWDSGGEASPPSSIELRAEMGQVKLDGYAPLYLTCPLLCRWISPSLPMDTRPIFAQSRSLPIIERMGKYLWPKVYRAWHMPDALQGEP